MRSGLGYSALLEAVMAGHATSLCQAVCVGPLRDGSFKRFTDLDRSFVYNPTTQDSRDPSGSGTFYSYTGADISTISSASDLSVDNAEMATLPGDDGFNDATFLDGGLDGCEFRCYIVDYTDLSLGHILLWGGNVGEVRRQGLANLVLEWRSRLNKYKQPINQPWSRDCRAIYGSQPLGTGGGVVEEKYPCGIDLSTRWLSGVVTSTHPTDTDKTIFTLSAIDPTGIFNRGMVRATSGANSGIEREIESYTYDDISGEARFDLLVAFPYDFAEDDTFDFRDGCNKTPAACSDPTRWGSAWVSHYRGEPWMPLGDAGAVLVGGPAFPGDLGGTGEEPSVPPAPTPTPPPGGNENPGSPTARTINTGTVVTPSLTAGTAAAAANSTAVNAAIAGLTSGGIVRIAAGEWYFNTADPITIDQDNTRLDLATNNATIRAAHSNTTTTPFVHRDVVVIDGADQWEVVGGRIIGYRDTWTSAGGEAAFGVSEWAHGIRVTGGSTAGTIRDVSITKCVGDAISVGYSSNDVWVDNCKLSSCRRQGVSNGGDNLHVTGCEIYDISGASNGPCAGIDCEPDDPATAVNITVTGNNIHDCSGPGVLVWLDSSNITVEDNTIDRCSRPCLFNSATTGTFKGNVCRNNRNPAKFQNNSDGWTVGGAVADDADNNTFKNTGTTVTSGNTTTLSGESSATARHLDVDSTSSVTVRYNKYT